MKKIIIFFALIVFFAMPALLSAQTPTPDPFKEFELKCTDADIKSVPFVVRDPSTHEPISVFDSRYSSIDPSFHPSEENLQFDPEKKMHYVDFLLPVNWFLSGDVYGQSQTTYKPDAFAFSLTKWTPAFEGEESNPAYENIGAALHNDTASEIWIRAYWGFTAFSDKCIEAMASLNADQVQAAGYAIVEGWQTFVQGCRTYTPYNDEQYTLTDDTCKETRLWLASTLLTP